MKRCHLLSLFLAGPCLLAAQGIGQDRPSPGGASDKSILKRFDTNGDGQIDDTERRAVREKMKQMQSKPGATTPANEPQTIGDRVITEMQYASSDGKKIPCVLSMPKGNGPFPMLVTIHGGQGNRDFAYIRSMAAPNGLSPTIAAFNEQPWAILAISYRAGNGALFGMEQDDVVAGIRFAKTLPKVDSNRVGVVGGSHGGHLALVAAEKMGREFLCVAVGSPWMTDPVVYMTGDPAKPPLSKVPAKAREELQLNGRRILNGMKTGRRMSDQQIKEFLAQHSIEAQAEKIAVPTLFITSRGDDQAPHALIEPMIERMQAAKKEVEVYTAEKSPHGFYWARTVSAARDLRGEKTPQEAEEEWIARRTMIGFFAKHFSRENAKTDHSPQPGAQAADVSRSSHAQPKPGQEPNQEPDQEPDQEADQEAKQEPAGKRENDAAEVPSELSEQEQADGPAGEKTQAGQGLGGRGERGARMQRGNTSGGGFGGADFQTLAGDTGKITREALKKQFSGSAAFASRPELVDRLFERLDADGDGALSKTEYEAMSDLKSQFGRGGQPGQSGASGRNANRAGRAGGNMSTPSARKPGGVSNGANQSTGGSGNPVAAKTEPVSIATGDVVGEQAGDLAANVGLIRELDLPVKPIIDGRLVKAVPSDLFAQGLQARIPVLIGAANGESGARQLSDEVATGGAFGFQRQLADRMVRAAQQVWMFQLTYVPPQSRDARFAAKHGESVAYAFGTIGQSLAAQYGFRNEQVASNAARMRRGGAVAGNAAGGGREDDSQPVEDSDQGRAISAAMLEYWISFMRDGQPSGKQLPAWPAYTTTAPKTMVFGNEGISVK